MTKSQLEKFVRSQIETFDGETQGRIGMRAIGREVWAWSYLTVDQLHRLYAASRAIALIDGIA